MRVISGLAKGYALIAPDGIVTRPTADRVKESLFNMIAFDLPDTAFLDLFCGTGAIGIEALSREAEHCTFVDSSAEACRITEYNLKHTRLADKALVINSDYLKALDILAADNRCYDFIFMDPPYYKGLADKAVLRIGELGLLKEEGSIIIEAALNEKIDFPKKIDFTNLYIYKEKNYRVAKMVILRGKY